MSSELVQYTRELRDKRILQIPSPTDARGYYCMRRRQQKQTVPVASASKEDVVAQAYLHTFALRNRVTPQEWPRLDAKTKAIVYDLYLAGVLPVRLGGVNVE